MRNFELKYDREIYLKSIFEGNTIYFETAMFIGEEDEINLLHPVKKILSFTNYGLDKEYVEGKDYLITSKGSIKRIKGSSMPYIEFDSYYTIEKNQYGIEAVNERTTKTLSDHRYLFYGEGEKITRYQVAISYEFDDIYDGPKPVYQGGKVSKFLNKLVNKEPATILFYGDSITVGCNASGTEYGGNSKPFMPSFPMMIKDELEAKYISKLNYINAAVAGMNTDWGVTNVKERVCAYNPDLVLIGFGMNDPSLNNEQFADKIFKMIREIEKTNPNVEFVIYSTTVPNVESNWYDGNQKEYYQAVMAINKPNVAVVNMTPCMNI